MPPYGRILGESFTILANLARQLDALVDILEPDPLGVASLSLLEAFFLGTSKDCESGNKGRVLPPWQAQSIQGVGAVLVSMAETQRGLEYLLEAPQGQRLVAAAATVLEEMLEQPATQQDGGRAVEGSSFYLVAFYHTSDD